MPRLQTREDERLEETRTRKKYWKRWGPYLSERQWGTVREDYSPGGTAWEYFPHDHARSRAYRWGEDGIGGICDRHQMICFGLAMWNGRDPILKERLFGLTGNQGNHGEDVKEYYFYLDSTPTHRYMKMLYKYPHAEFPYDALVAENRPPRPHRSRIRIARHRRLRRQSLLRRFRRIRQSRRRRHPHQNHRRQSRPGAAPLSISCLRSGFAIPGPGAAIARRPSARKSPDLENCRLHRSLSTGNTASAGCSAKASRNCSSPKTKPITQRLFADRIARPS